MTRQRGFLKYREVCYLDDGVYRFQCLACKDTWDMLRGTMRFCMSCGVKWEGELVWRNDTREARDLLRGRAAKSSPGNVWVIEHRVVGLPWESRWTDYGYPVRVTDANAVKMYALMKDVARWNDNCEFRVVMRAASAA